MLNLLAKPKIEIWFVNIIYQTTSAANFNENTLEARIHYEAKFLLFFVVAAKYFEPEAVNLCYEVMKYNSFYYT